MSKYTEREKRIMYNAMQFAVKEVNGRGMRQTFAEIMVEDFIKEMEKLSVNE